MLCLPREDNKVITIAKEYKIPSILVEEFIRKIKEVEERTQGDEMLVVKLCLCGYVFFEL